LIFNHINGRTYLKDEQEKLSDITEQNSPLAGYVVKRLLDYCPRLKKPLISIFKRLNNRELPFCEDDFCLETFIIINRFRGFLASFYDAIPFAQSSRKIYTSFLYIANDLKDYRNIADIYQHYKLPVKKAIRKIIFERPEFLFYTMEIVQLSFLNYDVLLQILHFPMVFEFLAHLHTKPELFIFLRQMVKEEGSVKAWGYIKHGLDNFVHSATDYFRVAEGRIDELTIKRW
jgi:hypothetical protein